MLDISAGGFVWFMYRMGIHIVEDSDLHFFPPAASVSRRGTRETAGKSLSIGHADGKIVAIEFVDFAAFTVCFDIIVERWTNNRVHVIHANHFLPARALSLVKKKYCPNPHENDTGYKSCSITD